MANPTPVMPPPPPGYVRPPLAPRPRSLAGPIIMIVIGTLFLLENMGMDLPLMYLFARYWPLLLIFVGLVKLIETQRAHSTGHASPGLGFFGGLVLILFIFFGLAATAAYRFNWSRISSEINVNDNSFGIFTNIASFEDSAEHDFKPGGHLKINQDRGDVVVRAWDQPKIKVIARKRVFTSVFNKDQGAAEAGNQQSHPAFSGQVDMLTLDVNSRSTNSGVVISDVEIFVPRNAVLEVLSLRGRVQVEGRDGDVNLHASRGDVAINDIKGNATIHMRNGDLSANKVTGDVSVEGRADDITLSDVGGRVSLEGDFFGDKRFTNIGKAMRIKTSRQELEVEKVGTMYMEPDDIRGQHLTGPVRLVSRGADIEFAGLTGPVRIDTRDGAIELSVGAAPLGEVELHTGNGNIRVSLPASAGFQLEVQARHGEIKSEFDIKPGKEEEGRVSAAATIGKGGPRVKLTTDNGNVQVLKATI